MGLVALWHVRSSQTRDQTCVPCIGRWILNHSATREVLYSVFKITKQVSILMRVVTLIFCVIIIAKPQDKFPSNISFFFKISSAKSYIVA